MMIADMPVFDDDKFHEECGVFGVFGSEDAAALTALGLHALQHRGQEACGVVSYDGQNYYSHKALGLVDSNFSDVSVIEKLKGHAAIGHNRYSTSGEPALRNVQPMYADMDFGGFSVAHNGNLTNAHMLRKELVKRGSIRRTGDFRCERSNAPIFSQQPPIFTVKRFHFTVSRDVFCNFQGACR